MFERFKNYMSIATLAKPEPKSPAPNAETQIKKDKEPPRENKPPTLAQNSAKWGSLETILGRPKKLVEQEPDISTALWKSNIPSNIGFPVLRNFENAWTMIHENNIDLGRAAERTDRLLHSVISHANNHHKALRDLEKSFAGIPALVERLHKTVQLVDEIRERIINLEENYEAAVKARMDKSFFAWRKNLSDALITYEESKKEEITQFEFKCRIEKQRADRDEEIHQNLLRLQRIRQEERVKQEALDEYKRQQAAFDKAFREQLQAFKPAPSVNPGDNALPELEQLDFAPEDEGLESFLDDDVQPSQEPVTSAHHDNSDDEFPQIEVLPTIEDPNTEAEYQRYLNLQYENLTSDLPVQE